VGLFAGLVGLTRLGERPAPLERLAAIVDRSAVETAALVRRDTTARIIEGGLIHRDEPFPGDRTLRTLYVGDREVPMKSGCAPDLFGIAAVLDVPFRVEDTCAATGAPIRVDFVPDGLERVDPPDAVTVLLPIGVSRWGRLV
jgi:alkylmercury lyase-like protein